MKNIAKILCFVLSLVLVFTLIGVSTFADGAVVVDSEAALRSALKTSGSIKLGGDIHVTSEIEVPAGVNVTLDLAGHNITSAYQTGSDSKHIYPLRNNGVLTIKDSVGTGSITGRGIYNGTSGADGDGVVLTLDGVKVYSQDWNGGAGVWGYGAKSQVYLNNATIVGNIGIVSSEGYLEINGGTYTCYSGVGDDGVLASGASYTYNVRAYNGLKITDGTFTSRHGVVYLGGGEGVIENGSFTINFIAPTTSNVVYVSGNAELTVNGGEFLADNTSGKGDSGAAVHNAGGNVTINDGTFVGMNGMVDGNTTVNGGSFDTVFDGYDAWGNIQDKISVGSTVEVGGELVGKAQDGTIQKANIVATDSNGNVTYYTTLDELFTSDLINTSDDYTVMLNTDVTATNNFNIRDSRAGFNFVTEVEGGVTMTFAYADDWNYVGYTSIGKNITLNADYLCVYGVVFDVYGTVNADYLYGLNGAITVKKGGVVNVTTGDATVQAKNNTWLEVYGTLNAGTVNVWNSNSRPSNLIVGGENASLTANHIHAWDGGSATQPNTITVENGATLSAKNLQADRDAEITVDNATVISDNIALGYGDNVGALTMQNGAKLQLPDGGKITTSANSSVEIDDTSSVKAIASVTDENGNTVYYTTSLQAALDAAVAGKGNVVVDILVDVDLNGVDWNPVTVSAPNYPFVTVNGNGHTITGLNDMLFAGTWAGKSGLVINDLTIADSDIKNDVDDTKGTVGVGAFVGFPQASAIVTLNNCHLVNSKVSGGHWTGGLIGYAAGYAGTDGPVFMTLTINGCSVTGSTITGKGSAGGVIGHGTGNSWTNLVIVDTIVRDNTVTSTGSSNNKAGAVVGTIGAAGQSTTVNGVTHTGGVSVDATVTGNNVTSNGTTITTIYGRQGSGTGALEITGGSYEHYPIEEGATYANVSEELKLVQGADGHFGTVVISATPEIIDGYWWIGGVNTGMLARPDITIEYDEVLGMDCWFVHGESTGIKATGKPGVAPQVAVINGFWYIDNNDGLGLLPTGVSAQGSAGVTIVEVRRVPEASDDFAVTYEIVLSNEETFRFTVLNGVDGGEGRPGPQGPEGAKGDRGDQGLPGKDGNDNNKVFVIVAVISTLCIISTVAILLYRGIDRRSWWCTR